MHISVSVFACLRLSVVPYKHNICACVHIQCVNGRMRVIGRV